MKPVWAAWLIGFSVILSLLAAGILYLSSSKPKGEPIRLNPLPTARPLVVQVGGAVAQPGVYQLSMGSRVQDAIQAAGGPLPAANIELVNQAAPLQDGELVWVRRISRRRLQPPLQALLSRHKGSQSERKPHPPASLST
jgi:DNA uptake protein ComE-like DNA-binding protein